MIHQFSYAYTADPSIQRGNVAGVAGGDISNSTIISVAPRAAAQVSDIDGRTEDINGDSQSINEDVVESLRPAFRWLDVANKNYWSDIRVPTKDSTRFVNVRIATASVKSLQIWIKDLEHGRVVLPVISVSRSGESFNPAKFTPPYRYIRKRVVDSANMRAELTFRPVPYNVNYTLSIWTEHRRDIEYILYQVLTRFNPLAEFRASDGYVSGNIQMKLDSSSDSSDKEAAADQLAATKYDISYTCEAWLSLPNKVVPLVAGTVIPFEEISNRISGLPLFTLGRRPE